MGLRNKGAAWRKNGIPQISVTRVEDPTYVIDPSKLRRFNARNNIFQRVMWDSSWEGYQRKYDEKAQSLVAKETPGYSRVDFAMAYASWIVHDAFKGGFSWTRIKSYRTQVDTAGIDWTATKYHVQNPNEMSEQVKCAARLFGASLVGICKLKRDWVYAGIEIPETLENVIVIAVEMDANGIAASPAVPAATATGVGYSRMAFTAACTGEFIRNLGYQAIQCGNDTVLSIPLAIDAGLGELGRNGLLITPQYGSRVRICKVITDLPLEADKPIEFGVKEFCGMCKMCSKHCEAEAISSSDEPSFKTVSNSNNPGALKWYVDVDKCYLFWCENSVDCSTCIKVCPFSIASAKRGSHANLKQ